MKEHDLSEEYYRLMAEEIQKEIDNSVMFDILLETGWHPVRANRNLNFNKPLLDKVSTWLANSCKGKHHKKSHDEYIFELYEDAVLFALKWS